jgi:energy-converting hydrogenase Eha subunit C
VAQVQWCWCSGAGALVVQVQWCRCRGSAVVLVQQRWYRAGAGVQVQVQVQVCHATIPAVLLSLSASTNHHITILGCLSTGAVMVVTTVLYHCATILGSLHHPIAIIVTMVHQSLRYYSQPWGLAPLSTSKTNKVERYELARHVMREAK